MAGRPHADAPPLLISASAQFATGKPTESAADGVAAAANDGVSAEARSEARSRSSDGGLPPIFQVISALGIVAAGGLVHLGASLLSPSPSAHARTPLSYAGGYAASSPSLRTLPPNALLRATSRAEETEALTTDDPAFAPRGAESDARASASLLGDRPFLRNVDGIFGTS